MNESAKHNTIQFIKTNEDVTIAIFQMFREDPNAMSVDVLKCKLERLWGKPVYNTIPEAT